MVDSIIESRRQIKKALFKTDTLAPSRASRLVLIICHLGVVSWMVSRLEKAEQVVGIQVGKELLQNYITREDEVK